MRFWVQVFSSRERNPNFHEALEQHLRSVVEPGVELEVHGTRKGGLGEQSCMMGKTFSLITPNPKFALSFEQKLKLYGLTERLTSIEAMNIPNLADYRQGFIDPQAHQRVMTEFDQAARRAVAAGAEVLIPCGSHAVLQARRGLREIDGALIVDGLAMLMKMAETAVRLQKIMGTVVSRKLLYQMPGEDVRAKAQQDYGIKF